MNSAYARRPPAANCRSRRTTGHAGATRGSGHVLDHGCRNRPAHKPLGARRKAPAYRHGHDAGRIRHLVHALTLRRSFSRPDRRKVTLRLINPSACWRQQHVTRLIETLYGRSLPPKTLGVGARLHNKRPQDRGIAASGHQCQGRSLHGGGLFHDHTLVFSSTAGALRHHHRAMIDRFPGRQGQLSHHCGDVSAGALAHAPSRETPQPKRQAHRLRNRPLSRTSLRA